MKKIINKILNWKYFNHVKNSPVDYFLPGLIPQGSSL